MSSRAEPPSEEQRALARVRLVETGEAIATAAERLGRGHLVAGSARVVDAWGRCPPGERARLDSELAAAAETAARRVAAEIRALSATDVDRQRVTPLELVRTLAREPTAVLAGAGIPAVVRDRFDERAAPDDHYSLAPRSLGDLGDDDLSPLQLAWGLAKARVFGA